MAAKGKTRPHRKGKGASAEALTTKGRVVVSTGGGEPIPKGHKWTTEERDEGQPRTEDGKFGTYSSVGKTTKYPQHAWRGTYEEGHPLNPTGKKLTEKQKKKIWEEDVKETPEMGRDVRQHYAQKMEGTIKAGTKIAVNDSIFIAAIDMTVEEFCDYLRYAWQGDEEKLGALSEALVRKKGARTKAEREALQRVKTGRETPNGEEPTERDEQLDPYRMQVVTDEEGNEEMANMDAPDTKRRIEEAAKAYQERLNEGFPKYDMSQVVVKSSLDPNSEKFKANQAHNQAVQAAIAAARAKIMAASQAAQQSAPQQQQPTQQQNGQKVASIGNVPLSGKQLDDAINEALAGIKLPSLSEGASQEDIDAAADEIAAALSGIIGI